MNQKSFLEAINQETDFTLRRAIERLREGLFDPTAVRLLTEHESVLNTELEQKFRKMDIKKSNHWCVCGAYGQGKSHSLTYIREHALRNNCVTSMINLDIREIPFYNVKAVYRAILSSLRFPDSDESLAVRWKNWSNTQIKNSDTEQNIEDLLPKEMPHRFKSILAAIAQKNQTLTEKQKQTKKHAGFRPREFPYILSKALLGEDIPIYRLRTAIKYRQVSFYKDASLSCKGIDPYLKMIEALSELFQTMGYRGLVILFDEGESIAQMRVPQRNKSYEILDQFFNSSLNSSVLPVFAFTNDFFQKVEDEDYEKVKTINEGETPYFKKDYVTAWEKIEKLQLRDLSKKEWKDLIGKLIEVYSRAYRWEQTGNKLYSTLEHRLKMSQGQETRFRLKSLIDELDLQHQEILLN